MSTPSFRDGAGWYWLLAQGVGAGDPPPTDGEVPPIDPPPPIPPGDEDPIFIPPAQVNPITWTPNESMQSSSQYISTTAPVAGQSDLIVQLPAGRALTRGIALTNWRHVRIIGGEITINERLTSASTQINRHRAIGCVGCTGVIYLEGVAITNRGGGLTEGIQTWACANSCILLLKNCRLDGIDTKPGDVESYNYNHPDFVQPMSGSFYARNCTFANSTYQGLYMQGEGGYALQNIRLKNVNVRGVRRKHVWMNNPRRSGLVWDVNDNVWVFVNTQNTWPWGNRVDGSTPTNAGYWGNWNSGADAQYFEPAPTTHTGGFNNGVTTYVNRPNCISPLVFNRGIPPGGDFAPLDKVGFNYDPQYFLDRFYAS